MKALNQQSDPEKKKAAHQITLETESTKPSCRMSELT